MDFPFKGGNKGKNKVDKIHFCNRGEGFNIVNAFNLWKSFSNKTSFMFIHFSIWSKLCFVNPFASDKFSSLWKRNKIQVLFANKERYSSFIASSQSGWPEASSKVSGSSFSGIWANKEEALFNWESVRHRSARSPAREPIASRVEQTHIGSGGV